ncbi:gamma-glutamyltranspeptidase [Apiospora phragmitis]|uniref:Glutathione hydrolase n=1 Tax=Apiospora phragmitis TaxID=2905665 RepID=A0ABR1WWC0_9PEZI
MVLLKSIPGSLIALLVSTTSSPAAAYITLPIQPPSYRTNQAVFPHPHPLSSSSSSSDESSSSSSSSSSTKGAVATESKTCSQIGIDLLARGGNAVDAWVGAQLCVGVIGMHHSGLGGGGFALVRDAHGNYTVIDYREAAPAAAYEGMFKHNVRASVFGGLAAAVPGELRGLEAAHEKFGALPWHAVVKPAADVAREGFEVTEDMVRYMAYGVQAAGWNFLVDDPSWARDFAPSGSLVQLGETMTRRRYAATLDAVAAGGADVFYEGALANATIAALQAANGTMTLDDMRDYRALLREPINITYGDDFRLFSTGAPSSGAVCLGTLKTMEGYHSYAEEDANLTMHRFDEAMRFGYAAHQQLGDPDFLGDGLARLEKRMLSDAGAALTRAKILDNATQPVEAYFPTDEANGNKPSTPVYARASHGTSHIVTADASGMAVSSTTTVNLLFGNLVMVPATGVILNNEMNDFSIPGVSNEFGYAPSPANFVRPGKRPLSSINPVIIEEQSANSTAARLFAVLGAAGGSRIPSSTMQVAWRLLESRRGKKKNPTTTEITMLDAIREPRFHDQLMPNTATFEYSFDNATVASLAARGHNVSWVREGYSAVQGIRVLPGDDEEGDDGSSTIAGFEAVGETRQKNSGGLSS